MKMGRNLITPSVLTILLWMEKINWQKMFTEFWRIQMICYLETPNFCTPTESVFQELGKSKNPSPYSGFFKMGSKAWSSPEHQQPLAQQIEEPNVDLPWLEKYFPPQIQKKLFPRELCCHWWTFRNKVRTLYWFQNDQSANSWISIFCLLFSLEVVRTFRSADTDPGYRPVSQIAEIGRNPNENFASPQFFMVKTSSESWKNNQIDFRDELVQSTLGEGGLKMLFSPMIFLPILMIIDGKNWVKCFFKMPLYPMLVIASCIFSSSKMKKD